MLSLLSSLLLLAEEKEDLSSRKSRVKRSKDGVVERRWGLGGCTVGKLDAGDVRAAAAAVVAAWLRGAKDVASGLSVGKSLSVSGAAE